MLPLQYNGHIILHVYYI